MIKRKSNLSAILGNISNGEFAKSELLYIDVNDLLPFPMHPFKIYSTEKMNEMVDSVKANGIIQPLVVRNSKEDGKYEIIAGHNRCEAAKIAGIEKVPAIIKEIDDEAAAIMMVDTNFQQRDEILPSEKAFAYKIKLDAMKKQGERTDLTSAQDGQKLNKKTSRDEVAEQAGESKNQISRYIRLTELINPLLDKVDNKKLSFVVAVSISYLDKKEQEIVNHIIEKDNIKISAAQANLLKHRSKENQLNEEKIRLILLGEEKRNRYPATEVRKQVLKQFLPLHLKEKEFSMDELDDIFTEAMLLWEKKHAN